MVEVLQIHDDGTNFYLIFHLKKLKFGCHIGKQYRKIIAVHLAEENFLQRLPRPMDTVNGDPISGDIGRRKKGESLNMIPVGVADKKVYSNGTRSELTGQFGAQNPYARARVKYQNVIVVSNFNAGGVASVTDGVGTGGRNGAARSPKLDSH